TSDPVFDTSKEDMKDLFAPGGEFSACEVTREVTESTRTTYLHDYKFCSRVVDSVTGRCTVKHPYKLRVIEHVSGPLNIQTCGSGCLDVWLGNRGDDDYWSSGYHIYDQFIKLRVLNPDAIISVSLAEVWWVDYIQLWINGDEF